MWRSSAKLHGHSPTLYHCINDRQVVLHLWRQVRYFFFCLFGNLLLWPYNMEHYKYLPFYWQRNILVCGGDVSNASQNAPFQKCSSSEVCLAESKCSSSWLKMPLLQWKGNLSLQLEGHFESARQISVYQWRGWGILTIIFASRAQPAWPGGSKWPGARDKLGGNGIMRKMMVKMHPPMRRGIFGKGHFDCLPKSKGPFLHLYCLYRCGVCHSV